MNYCRLWSRLRQTANGLLRRCDIAGSRPSLPRRSVARGLDLSVSIHANAVWISRWFLHWASCDIGWWTHSFQHGTFAASGFGLV